MDAIEESDYREALAQANYITHHTPNPGRNDKCPCGSGKKYKACHMRLDEEGVPGDEFKLSDKEE
jgi:uncharacterized protein YecA (UPF0149 family)